MNKTKNITIQVAEADYLLLKKKASESRLSLAGYIRLQILSTVKKS